MPSPPPAPASSTHSAPAIRVGVGGWTYEPWRNNFFPKGLPHSRELEYASRKLTTIEVNGTYYGTLKPSSFQRWAQETPDDFVLSLKATRYATNRRVLAEAGESISRFVDSGISELGNKLGPVVWQFMPGKVFEPEDFEAFLDLLPKKTGSLTLRHVVDVRHESFMTPAFLALARRYRVATVFADAENFPSFSDLTSDFVYARLMASESAIDTGYAAAALDAWAGRDTDHWAVADAARLAAVRADRAAAATRVLRNSRFIFVSWLVLKIIRRTSAPAPVPGSGRAPAGTSRRTAPA